MPNRLRFALNLQLFADNEKSPTEILLERIDNLEKDVDNLKKENKEIMDFNRALLNRNRKADSHQDTDDENKDAKAKLNKYLEEY